MLSRARKAAALSAQFALLFPTRTSCLTGKIKSLQSKLFAAFVGGAQPESAFERFYSPLDENKTRLKASRFVDYSNCRSSKIHVRRSRSLAAYAIR